MEAVNYYILYGISQVAKTYIVWINSQLFLFVKDLFAS